MKYVLIRHAQTDANRMTRATFGKTGAPINSTGEVQARKLKTRLYEIGVDVKNEPVVVSELLRTRQTAEAAGFNNISVNSLLNEVNTTNPQKTLDLVAEKKLPIEATKAAKAIIDNPPTEKFWITHGLVIAAILVELGLSDSNKFIPDFCEMTEIEI